MDQVEFTRLIDDTLQRQLGYPDEQELIEILNKYEFEMETAVSDREGRARQVRLLHEHLARRQGGTLDRFGLRTVPVAELEHRLETLETELKHFVETLKRKAAATSLLDKVILTTQLPAAQFEAFVKKKLVLELRLRIKLGGASTASSPSSSPADDATEKAKAALKKIAALQAACEDTLKQTPPDLQDDIKRVYQKQIDRIRADDL